MSKEAVRIVLAIGRVLLFPLLFYYLSFAPIPRIEKSRGAENAALIASAGIIIAMFLGLRGFSVQIVPYALPHLLLLLSGKYGQFIDDLLNQK